MNLIEQLVGYEEALKLFKGCPWDSGTVDVPNPRSIGMLRLDLCDLRFELLEHRRAHNIFEEGDYIIHDGELKVFAMWSNVIDGCAYIGYAYAEDGEMAHKDEFRHATDAEIEVEHRL